MENNTLGDNIARFRKAAGLTQEELGTTVGVSAQAVSRWECGGAPDISLHPAVADALGVSIDALFGREPEVQSNLERAVARWLNTFPEEERMDRFCRLTFDTLGAFLPGEAALPKIGYLGTAAGSTLGGPCDHLMYTRAHAGGGLLLDLHAEDLSFVSLWPRPRDGYAAWLAPKDDYRRLFEVLSRPNCLELLWYLQRRKFNYFPAVVAARETGLPLEEVEPLLEALAGCEVLFSMDMDLEDGERRIYQLAAPLHFIPFLYLARSFMQSGYNYLCINDRDRVLGPDEVWPEKKED